MSNKLLEPSKTSTISLRLPPPSSPGQPKQKCTRTGTVVYKRPPHSFSWKDFDRIAKKLPAIDCFNIDSVNALARVFGRVFDAFAACPREVRRAIIFALLGRMGYDIVSQWVDQQKRGSKDSGFGGAMATRDISKKKPTLNR